MTFGVYLARNVRPKGDKQTPHTHTDFTGRNPCTLYIQNGMELHEKLFNHVVHTKETIFSTVCSYGITVGNDISSIKLHLESLQCCYR